MKLGMETTFLGTRSGMRSNASTAFRSKSLKSEALDISIPETLLII